MTDITMEDANVRARARIAFRLAADLARIRDGSGPTAEELSLAPLIEDWITVPVVGTGLRGTVEGMPGPVSTGELFILDTHVGFARTFGRFYRLGKQGRP